MTSDKGTLIGGQLNQRIKDALGYMHDRYHHLLGAETSRTDMAWVSGWCAKPILEPVSQVLPRSLDRGGCQTATCHGRSRSPSITPCGQHRVPEEQEVPDAMVTPWSEHAPTLDHHVLGNGTVNARV